MLRRLFEPLGLRRSQVLWRGTGLAAVLVWIASYHFAFRDTHRSIPLSWNAFVRFLPEFGPPADHLMVLAGLLLVVLGGSVATLLAMGITSLVVTVGVAGDLERFAAAELPLFFVLPFGALVVAAFERGRDGDGDARARRDAAIARVFRVTLATSLAFSAFHKLNRDFFNVDVSCVTQIEAWLIGAWGPAGEALAAVGSPLQTVLMEGLLAVLVVVAPRAAVVGVALFFAPLGLVAASRITAIMMVMSWAGLPRADFERGRERRRWIVFAALWLPLVAISCAIYRVRDLGPEGIALIEAFAVFGIASALTSGRPWFGAERERGVPLARSTRRAIAGTALLLVLNGLTPYFGFKYNFSFAMWSNLRVDAVGWNSFVVPRAVRFVAVEERYLAIEHAEVTARYRRFAPRGPVEAAALAEVLRTFAARGGFVLDLVLVAGGERIEYAGDAGAERLSEVIERIEALAGDELELRRARMKPNREYVSHYDWRLEPSFFSPARFRQAIGDLRGQGFQVDLSFRYRREDYVFVDALTDDGFAAFVESLPKGNLDPGKLDATGPQRCLH